MKNKFEKWIKNNLKKMNMWDLGLAKLSWILIGIIAGAYFYQTVLANIGALIIILILAASIPLYKVFLIK